MRQKLLLAVITVVVSLFMGCSLQTTVPPMAKYSLDIDFQKASAPHGPYSDKVVRIAQLESSTMLNGRMIVYTADNGQSYSYTKARWMESVNRQVSNLMIRSMTNSGLFKDVIEYRSKAKNDYLLEASIYDFTQRVHDDGSSDVHFIIKVRLLEQYSRKIVKNHTCEYSEKGLEGNVKGAMKGDDILMKKYLVSLKQWLSEASE